MLNLFKKKYLLPEDDEYFQIECYRWLLRNFGGIHFYKETNLILPTQEYFDFESSSSNDHVSKTFNLVKKYSGMENWKCELVAQEEDPDVWIAPTVDIKNTNAKPLGTFSSSEENVVTISYNPSIANNGTQLVATLAHELAHYLTATSKEDPPGGWDNWEFATDIAAVFLGFGIFMGNAAFSFEQFTGVDTQGWQTQSSGYLSEREYSFALAIFILLKEIDPKTVYKYCDKSIESYLKIAIKELLKSGDIDELKRVQYIGENS
jgi:hypothetical protein